jgi:hypothetical protein
MNRKWLIAVALVSLGGIILVVCIDRPAALPAVVILPSTPLVVKSGRVPDRWIPAKWTWLQKACQRVLGPPRTVWLDIQFREVQGTLKSIIAQNFLGQPLCESNGVAVWIVSARPRPRFIRDSPISAANLTVVKRTSFWETAEVFPRLKGETIDLSTLLIDASATQTNFVAAIRAQLPYDKELFVLDVRRPEMATNRAGIWIAADEIDASGNKVHRQTGGK